ncbi:MAG: hypothetical protein ABI045_05120 [Flavobacteriales bacterium]
MEKALSEKIMIFNKSFLKVFSVCLFFAFYFWLFVKLSKEYVKEIAYEIKYINLPLKRTFYKKPEGRLFIRQRSTGYILLINRMLRRNVLQIDVSKVINTDGKKAFWMPEEHIQTLSEKIGRQLIMNITPNIIWLPLSDMVSKTVRVKPDIDFEYKEEFRKKAINIKPEMIRFVGYTKVLDTLDQVFT